MKVTHRPVNSITAENLMRSAKAPTIRAGVMAANVSWKAMKVNSGMATPLVKVSAVESVVMPARNAFEKLPMTAPSAPSPPDVKATE
jgi:hypothetical protein